MANPTIPSADNISDKEFADYLEKYPSCIEALSESKGAKAGQKRLAELDQYRYGEAIEAFRPGKSEKPMGPDEVKTLVKWKLRHGTFRPALMKLVSSNEPDILKKTIQKAVKLYRDCSDISATLGILTQLKGIGPATASLLLAVHDEDNIIFFADEAFYWLCCGGSKGPIKYNLKEYITLNERAQAVTKRLGVKAVDVERVAFVLMKQKIETLPASIDAKRGSVKTPVRDDAKKLPPKRKLPADDSEDKTNLRRSKLLSKNDAMQSYPSYEPIALPRRFAVLKERIASNPDSPLEPSWQRLLKKLREELDQISTTSSRPSNIVPTIDFADISSPQRAEDFIADLRKRGVAIIRNVIPRHIALGWRQETIEYLGQNNNTQAQSSSCPGRDDIQLHSVFWSPAQIKARVHPNILAAQRFAMGAWRSEDPDAKITTEFPITYADRVRIRTTTPVVGGNLAARSSSVSAHVDNGSVERWEQDGYGRAGTYRKIFQGRWEEYDPWESGSRIAVTSDLYRGPGLCSIFRMFSGWLSLSSSSATSGPTLQVLPMPQLATAYFLLRPFFSPSSLSENDSDSWVLNPLGAQNSILHGALPSYPQVINPNLHPHLQLDRSLVTLPDLEPGDYVLWHPDLVHAILDGGGRHTIDNRQTAAAPTTSTLLYLPACPLTQTNALYLSRQRKAFLLGYPGPDFDFAGGGRRGENSYMGRAGVQEVNDAGGEDGLRGMGLLPWDEEDAASDAEREVLAMANSILFPDLYDDVVVPMSLG
ncbi:hypothetical protein B0H66DRAFT_571945 [Apodospora peruviana]|uniref:DUF1479-domain-containing protein n=1 Tax=Apodospora peruviana TaxID=516989 RepID=A0AAE0IR07_9PEZI|nr:hypothetical protein B0H66DRAFT_571945 [Apodospora peruviana]